LTVRRMRTEGEKEAGIVAIFFGKGGEGKKRGVFPFIEKGGEK